MVPIDKFYFTIAVLVNNTLFILSGQVSEGLTINVLAIDVADVSKMQLVSSYPYTLPTTNSTSAPNTTVITNSTGTTDNTNTTIIISPSPHPSLSVGAKAGISIGAIVGVRKYHYQKKNYC